MYAVDINFKINDSKYIFRIFNTIDKHNNILLYCQSNPTGKKRILYFNQLNKILNWLKYNNFKEKIEIEQAIFKYFT